MSHSTRRPRMHGATANALRKIQSWDGSGRNGTMPSDQLAVAEERAAKAESALSAAVKRAEDAEAKLREAERNAKEWEQAACDYLTVRADRDRAVGMLREAREKFDDYSMAVDEPAPFAHRRLMDRIDALLAEIGKA